MTADKIETILNRMVGKRYKYGQAFHTIASFEINEERERVFIYTTAGSEFDRNFDEFDYFISLWHYDVEQERI